MCLSAEDLGTDLGDMQVAMRVCVNCDPEFDGRRSFETSGAVTPSTIARVDVVPRRVQLGRTSHLRFVTVKALEYIANQIGAALFRTSTAADKQCSEILVA